MSPLGRPILGSSTDLINEISDQEFKAVTTPGTAVQLTTTKTPCLFVEVQASELNTKPVAVGGPNVLIGTGASYAGRTGTILQPGESKVFYIPYASLLYMDAQSTGDKVSWAIYK